MTELAGMSEMGMVLKAASSFGYSSLSHDFGFSGSCGLPVTCQEVVRAPSGWIVQTIDRKKQAVGTVQATALHASGRIISTAPPCR